MALDNAALKDLIAKKTVGPGQKREAVRFLTEAHALPPEPVLRLRGFVSCGLVCAATGLDRARCGVDLGIGQAGRGPAKSRFLEVQRSTTQEAIGLESEADLSGIQGDEAQPEKGRQAPPAKARACAAVCSQASRYRLDHGLHECRVGKRFQTFNVLDDLNREVLHIELDTSINSGRLVRVFEQLKRDHGLPPVRRSDNGPEFLGEAFTQWAKLSGVALRYIQPGKPNQNAFIERFNRTFREEVLDQHLFARLEDVREAAHWWMIDYNEIRPHDSLSGMSPVEYRTAHARSSTLEMSA